jgi:hypothetical protein
MSPSALRWLAVPLSLVAFAANMVRVGWFEPLTYHMGFGWGLAASEAGALVALGVPVGVFLMLAYRRPASFQRAGDRLVAPAHPAQAGLAIVSIGIAGEVPWESGHLPVGLAAAAFYVVAAAVALLIQRPRLELDPAGLTIRHLRTVERIEWERFAPGEPLPPTRKRPRELRAYLNDPPAYQTFRPSVAIPVKWLFIDAAYLVEKIRLYVDHPEARSEIATPEDQPASR